jgi:hypothetical protein
MLLNKSIFTPTGRQAKRTNLHLYILTTTHLLPNNNSKMFSKSLTHIFLGSFLLVPALAHMNMNVPPPLRHKDNPHTQNPKDYYDFPLKKDGSDFPCKGYLDALDTPEGGTVATWAAGSEQVFSYVFPS